MYYFYLLGDINSSTFTTIIELVPTMLNAIVISRKKQSL